MNSPSSREQIPCHETVAAVCAALHARAAGYWHLESRRLIQVAFAPGEGLDPDAARQFAEATRSVSMDQSGLGIVAAAVSGQIAVSRVAELPPDSGSGRWLRAFGAARSVAVPLSDDRGEVRGVFSVALPVSCTLEDQAVADRICQAVGDFLAHPADSSRAGACGSPTTAGTSPVSHDDQPARS
jgi:hypothetical protein